MAGDNKSTSGRGQEKASEQLGKRKRVVYVFGAGFSAGLGLPVMGNWFTQSQVMRYDTKLEAKLKYYLDELRQLKSDNHLIEFIKDPYLLLRIIADSMAELTKIKNYYDFNLFNMEDLFSLLTMKSNIDPDPAGLVKQVTGKEIVDLKKILYTEDAISYYMGLQKENKERGKDWLTLERIFTDYIIMVTNYFTPLMGSYKKHTDDNTAYRIPSRWPNHLFGPNESWNRYGLFFGALWNLRFQIKAEGHRLINSIASSNIIVERELIAEKDKRIRNPEKPNEAIKSRAVDYGIISFNYDTIPDKPIDYIRSHNRYPGSKEFEYVTELPKNKTDPFEQDKGIPLARIHGDVELRERVLIPPTWSKTFENRTGRILMPRWQLAVNLLKQATDIRIIGYSLPITDVYIKHLLASAITNSDLQTIHVITRDSTGAAKANFDQFIGKFSGYQFANIKSIDDYLNYHWNRYDTEDIARNGDELRLDQLEKAHTAFMKDPQYAPPKRSEPMEIHLR